MFFCLTALFVLFASNGIAQSRNQSEKLQSVVNEFFELYNSGDTAAYRKFLQPTVETTAQLNQVLTGFNNAYRMIGKVDIKRVQVNSLDKAEVWARDKKYDSWWKFSIYTDSSQNFKRRTVQPVPFEEYFLQSGKLSKTELRDSIQHYIQSKLGKEFSGNVFIAKEHELIYANSFGNNQNNQPNNFNQQFDLASMGKVFTAISILQLRDKHELSLNDQVKEFVPELKNKSVGNLTIQQLLTHTSGMGDFFDSPLYQKLKDSLKNPKDYMPFFESDQLSFAAGKGWRYSNTGYALLGLIIERISGAGFAHYVEHNIFNKAFMKNSIVGGGAGGGYSTVNDLHKFSLALMKNSLLKEETTRSLIEYTVNGKYGYGTEHQQLADENIIGHSGGFINVCTELNLYTKNNYIVIILSNSNPPYAHFLSNKIKELLVRK
jgi:CubicO group peptidase (beta-lactamase class C family)